MGSTTEGRNKGVNRSGQMVTQHKQSKNSARKSMYTYVKRFFDVILSAVGLVVLALPMAIVAILVKVDSRGPVFYCQERIGLGGRVFKMYKFRSMCVNAEHTGTGVYSGKGDVRVTRVGRILRATSIDELPQLLNIFLGQMSFIGPRPPLTYHPWPIEEYTPAQRRMFEVRPGITGWAQVNGRRCVMWPARIEMNVWYVDNMSALLDMKILILTVVKVLSNSDNENTVATVNGRNTQD